jgi:hypothetical protein
MSIGAISSNPLLWLAQRPETHANAPPAFDATSNDQANSAGPLSILPSSSAMQLSFENILALQSLADPPAPKLEEMSATQKFLAEAQKSPMERMREQVLSDLGLTEESLAQMPPEERRAAEDKIREMIEEKIRQAMGAGDDAPDSNSAMLQSLIGV